MSRLVLGPTQPPIQWVPGVLSPGVKRQDVKMTTHLQLVPRKRMVELYFHSPIRLHGIVLKLLSTGMLPLLYIHVARSSKVSDEATTEFFRIIKWSKISKLLISLVYDVWNELEQLVYKKQERTFYLWLLHVLQQRIENLWPVVSQDNIRCTVHQLEITGSTRNQRQRRNDLASKRYNLNSLAQRGAPSISCHFRSIFLALLRVSF
jgi:hypothetical protein